jgi:hypothetical protein
MYYRDPTAEDKGILDGVIDLNGVNSISEVQVARNYGFQTLVSVSSCNYYFVSLIILLHVNSYLCYNVHKDKTNVYVMVGVIS